VAVPDHVQRVRRWIHLASRETDLRWSPGSAGGTSAEEHVLGNLIQAEIVAAIRALPSRQRLMVYLADVKGLGYRQIADLTGIPVGTVKSSPHRSRGQLRARLAGGPPPAKAKVPPVRKRSLSPRRA
jgi:RNA polymerase sigma factor (sigma-70 family)